MSEADELRRLLEQERRARREAELEAERGRRLLGERRRDAELLEALATVANRATEVEGALRAAVARVCELLELAIGMASVVRTLGDAPRLVPVGQGWVRDEEAHGGVLTAALGDERPGPLAHRVLASGRAEGTTDLSEERWHLAGFAASVGLCSAVALPVVAGGRTVAVIECLSDRDEALTPELRATLELAGEQLAHVFARATEQDGLRHAATHDELTGLPNRAHFVERVRAWLARPEPAQGAIALLDLDRFKEVNDTLGHPQGDRLLVGVSERLSSALRRGDLLARFGGDEFTLLLPGVVGPDDAGVAAARIRDALDEPLRVGGVLVQVDASVGFALVPGHGADVAALVRHADVAMYAAKRAHLGHALYDPRADPYSPERLGMAAALRRALDAGDVEVHFQPKVALATGAVLGVEALARWGGAPGGPVSPSEFVPLAERTGLIQPLTTSVLRRALWQASQWWRAGLAAPVAVNVAAASLVDTSFPAHVERLLHEADVPARLLQLEVTEGMMVADPGHTRRVLVELDALGVAIAVDDFGTGYSSLAELRRLPVRELKIDRSLVSVMLDDPRDASIVRTSVALAHDLGMRAVAEGVEDLRTRSALEELGCDAAQGHAIRRPGTAEDLTSWLHGRERETGGAGGAPPAAPRLRAVPEEGRA